LILFSAWGRFVYRHRRPALVLSILVALGFGAFAPKAESVLSSGGWLLTTSESGHVADRLASDFGRGRSSLIVLFHVNGGDAQASDPAIQQEVATALAGLGQDARVHSVVTYALEG
jgi:RND superfamily putative drug exporter